MLTELIEGKLYQSGFPDFEEAVKNNIKLVIYLGKTPVNLPARFGAGGPDSITLGEDFSYIWWPFVDGPMPDTRILEGLANIAVGFLEKGQRVLVSCAAGINRSNLLACLIVMKFLGIDAKEAVEEVRKKNPLALVNENYYKWLIDNKTK